MNDTFIYFPVFFGNGGGGGGSIIPQNPQDQDTIYHNLQKF